MGKESTAHDEEEKKKKKKKKKKENADEITEEKVKSEKNSGPKDKPKKIKKKSKEINDEESSSKKKGGRTQATDDNKDHMVSHASGWTDVEITKSPDAKYAITGNESQVLTVALGPDDSCKGEPGSMMYLSPGVTQSATCDGCCQRCLSGEECFVLNFTNTGSSKIEYAAMTPNELLGKVVPVDLSSEDVAGTLIVQQGAYMGSYGDVEVGISLDCNFMRCCCGGAGLIRQKLQGSGTVFLGVTGTIVQKVLAPDEVMVMDTNCILAFAESCQLDIKRAGGMVGMIGGGEGIFNTTVTGPGLAIVQSMNRTMFAEALTANKMYRR